MAIQPFTKVEEDQDYYIPGAVWNRLVRTVEDLADLQASQPLFIDKSSSKMLISFSGITSSPFQICTLLADGGSGGSPGVSATYTYSIYALDGNTWGATTGTLLATQCPLFGPRIIAGPCTAAQAGLIWNAGTSGPPGVTGTVGNDPSGSGSGPHPTAYRIVMAYETFGTSVQVGSCP